MRSSEGYDCFAASSPYIHEKAFCKTSYEGILFQIGHPNISREYKVLIFGISISDEKWHISNIYPSLVYPNNKKLKIFLEHSIFFFYDTHILSYCFPKITKNKEKHNNMLIIFVISAKLPGHSYM